VQQISADDKSTPAKVVRNRNALIIEKYMIESRHWRFQTSARRRHKSVGLVLFLATSAAKECEVQSTNEKVRFTHRYRRKYV